MPEYRITRIQVLAEFGCFQNRVPRIRHLESKYKAIMQPPNSQPPCTKKKPSDHYSAAPPAVRFYLSSLHTFILHPFILHPSSLRLGGGFGFSPEFVSAEFGCFENRPFHFRATAIFSYEKKKFVTLSIKFFYR